VKSPGAGKIPGNEKLVEIATQTESASPDSRTPADLAAAPQSCGLSNPGATGERGNVITSDGGRRGVSA